MDALEVVAASAHWTSTDGPLVEFPHDEAKSQWLFDESSCER